MQSTILKQRDTAVNARQAFEQNAVLALQIRDELAHEVGEYPAGWSVAAGLRPAEGLVAGDCYDVSLLGPTEIGLVVLDIAGHGALAAISAFRCKELLKVALRNGLAPGSALDWLAGQELSLEDSFFTAFVGTIDTTTGRCYYANAGHPPALLRDADHRMVTLDPTGPLFGHIGPGWRTEEVLLGTDSVLTVYTDGLIEARNQNRDFYGEERLIDLLADMRCSEAQPAVDHVLNDLSEFHGGQVADDVTLVVLCRTEGDAGSPAGILTDDAIEGKDVGQSSPSLA
jgi:serine phosphatase RsbU (regulator of sigma subunit)